jgi:hypothetical protein
VAWPHAGGGTRQRPRRHPEGAWEADRSIELKIICAPDVAERTAAHILEAYCPNDAATL